MNGEGDLRKWQIENRARGRFEVGQGSQSNRHDNHPRRGKRRGGRGRGRPRHAERAENDVQAPIKWKRGRRTVDQMAREVENVYNSEANEDIRKIIENMEKSVLEEASDPELYDWCSLLSDPGNTRGHLSQYKQALHIFWVMK